MTDPRALNPFEEVEFRTGHNDTLDWVDRINAYPFDHEKVARDLFIVKKESEIVNTISKLTELQSDIDQVLRDKVTNNHVSFIKCSESIRKTGIELSELRNLVESTQDFIGEVSTHGLMHEDSDEGQSGSLSAIQALKKSMSSDKERYDVIKSMTKFSDSPNIPRWLQESPANLTRYMIEKSFSCAVNEILKVRRYKASSENNIDDFAERARIVRIFMTVDELGLEVARDLMQSLVKLPNSPLWGGSEQKRRLKLLISLGHYDFAAEAFSHASNDIIHTVLNDVEVSGDVQTYIMDLSKAFFASLQRVTVNFVTLFADYVDSPGVMSILVSWALDQVAALAGVICRQIELGAMELGALTVIHLKPKTIGAFATTTRKLSVTFVDSLVDVDGSAVDVGKRDALFSEHALSSKEIEELFGQDEANTEDPDPIASRMNDENLRVVDDSAKSASDYLDTLRIAYSPGPLTFVRQCLDVALAQSHQYASVALQGLDDLGWFMVPELKKAVMQYAEDLMTETVSQVKQDSWSGVTAPFWEIQYMDYQSTPWSPHGPMNKAQSGTATDTTGSSFTWFTLSLTHYLREVLVLLRASTEHTEINEMLEEEEEEEGSRVGESQQRSGGEDQELLVDDGEESADRDDLDDGDNVKDDSDSEDEAGRQALCELEPVVIVCLLRLVVVYSLELERVFMYSDSLNMQQRACIRSTMRALGGTTIPSLKAAFLELFFDVCFSRLDGRVLSPTASLDQVSDRMVSLASEERSSTQENSTL